MEDYHFRPFPLTPSPTGGYPSFVSRAGHRFLLVHLHEKYNEFLLKRFYNELILTHFPKEDELDPIETWMENLQSTPEDWHERGHTPRKFHITLALCPESIASVQSEDHLPIAAGCVYEYYSRSQSCIMFYMVVQKQYSKLRAHDIHDIGGREAMQMAKLDGLIRKQRDAANPSASAPLVPYDFFSFFLEAHSFDVDDGIMDSEKRHKVFVRLDMKVVGMDFVLAPVDESQEPCTDLILFTYVGKGHCLPMNAQGRLVYPVPLLKLFLEDFSSSTVRCPVEKLTQYDWWTHMMKDLEGKEVVDIEDFPWRRRCTFRKNQSEPGVHRGITVPIPDVPLHQFVMEHHVRQWPQDSVSQICAVSGRSITFGDIYRDSQTIGARLQLLGLRPKECIAMILPNCLEYVSIFYGTLVAGGIVSPMNPSYTAFEMRSQLMDSSSTMLFTVSSLLDRVKEAVSHESNTVRHIFLIDTVTPMPSSSAIHVHSLHELLHPLTPSERSLLSSSVSNHQINPSKDVCCLPYSSGTTGKNKGVQLSHRNMVSNLLSTMHPSIDGSVAGKDVWCGVLPFFHIYGLSVIMTGSLMKGVPLVIFPRFELPLFLSRVQEHRISRCYLVPPILLQLAKDPIVDNYDISSIYSILSGAAPLGKELALAVHARLGGRCEVKQGYGLTELSPVSHSHPDGCKDMKYPSAGPVLPNQEVKIVDLESGRTLERSSVDSVGEICVRGPNVFLGYLNNPKATAEMIDQDGWLHTGDIGYQDHEGFIFVSDRFKELIKFKGFQVAPAELEAILLGHPAIADVAVIGVHDDEAGEVPKAYVVRRKHHHNIAITASEVIEFCAAKTAAFKRIRYVEFVDQIEKTPSGKILRRKMREKHRATIQNNTMSKL